MPKARLTLDDLPLFASDAELARAIVGPERAADWIRNRLPTIARLPGFPQVDSVHGGRRTALVKQFYDLYPHRIGRRGGAIDQEENPTWTKTNSARRA